jgi:hypothetical protein
MKQVFEIKDKQIIQSVLDCLKECDNVLDVETLNLIEALKSSQ